jgi:hypothetical protein
MTLLDQLDLMDRRLDDVADDIARHDSPSRTAGSSPRSSGTSALQIAARRAPPERRLELRRGGERQDRDEAAEHERVH